jgi:predicted AAA+ superfamily ATPase
MPQLAALAFSEMHGRVPIQRSKYIQMVTQMVKHVKLHIKSDKSATCLKRWQTSSNIKHSKEAQ